MFPLRKRRTLSLLAPILMSRKGAVGGRGVKKVVAKGATRRPHFWGVCSDPDARKRILRNRQPASRKNGHRKK